MAALNENINRVISDFTAVKNAVESRGVTIEDNTPTSQYAQKILSIPDNTNTLRSLINGSLINLVIPENTVSVRDYFSFQNTALKTLQTVNIVSIGGRGFFGNTGLESVVLGNGLTSIGIAAFEGCTSMYSISLPGTLQVIEANAFKDCRSLQSVTIPSSVTSIGNAAFYNCSALKYVYIPSSVTSVGSNPFNLCSDVENLVIEQDFDVANFTIAGFGNLSVPTVVSVLNSLSNRVGKTNYTLYTGRYLSMLSEEQKAIATAKNWTLR